MRNLLIIIILLQAAALFHSDHAEKRPVLRSSRKIFEKTTPPHSLLNQPDTITLVFMGDVMMHKEQIRNAFNEASDEYVFDGYFSELRDIIDGADLSIANMEFTLGGKPYTGYPNFSAPDSYLECIRQSGVDICLTANNHILDKGAEGLDKTMNIYNNNGMLFTGTASGPEDDSLRNPLIVPLRGIRIAFANFTYGTNGHNSDRIVHRLDSSDVASCLARAEDRGADLIIVLPHWGIEYQLRHSKNQERWAEFFIRHGADAVIGSHPHVVQDADTLNGVPVVYSLGNLISNMSAANTRIGLIATLKVAVDSSRRCRILEPQYTMTWCARPGTIGSSYKTIPVREWMQKDSLWKKASDYCDMIASYERVKAKTGINDI